MTTWPEWRSAMRYALDALSKPPRKKWIERYSGVGAPLAHWVVPGRLCPPLNRYAELPTWKRQEVKGDVLDIMLAQRAHRRRAFPLEGRPSIRCVRFMRSEGDPDTGWSKVPVDRLQIANGGLGFIRDDRGSAIDLKCWWEPGPLRGFVYVAIYGGAS
jgi:hypothetical protein